MLPFIALTPEIKKIDCALESTAKKDAVIKPLMTVPGVGYLTALTYKVVVDEPTRFKNARAVGAYLGICPSMYASGQTKRQGRISKRGSQELRTLLTGAGLCLLVHCKKPSSLKTWGAKIQDKHGTKKAATAVRRKMSVIMHQLWCKNLTFDPGAIEEKNPSTSI